MAQLINGAVVVTGDDITRVNAVYLEQTLPSANDEGVNDSGFDEGTETSLVPTVRMNADPSLAPSGYLTNLSYGTYLTPANLQFALLIAATQLSEGGSGSTEVWGLVGE